MLFNSAVFLAFFSIVYPVYLRISHRHQNVFLLLASYVFYGWWDVRFLFLLFISSYVDFFCGLKIDAASNQQLRKRWLCLSWGTNLAILGFFKYFDFFISSFQGLFAYFGIPLHVKVLNVVLPVGISFYTFQAMSYSLDIYRRQLTPTRNLTHFLLSVSFFPHLVAGPIQRAANLLSQITTPRVISSEKIITGIWLFFYGLFQKAFVADNLAKIVDPVFASPVSNGALILIGVYAYAFQIYCDFAGYSNMARGLARLMGFELVINFRNPYFSTNPKEFWRRWHISLSSWLRDYVYIPLGGSRRNNVRTYINLLLTMFLGGLWHGAAWHFVLWGVYHGFLLVVQHGWEKSVFAHSTDRQRYQGVEKNGSVFNLAKLWKAAVFFQVICLGWILFRATDMDQAVSLITTLMTGFQWNEAVGRQFLQLLFFVSPLIVFELFEYRNNDPCFILKWHPVWQGMVYFLIYYLLMVYGIQGGEQFVYFQF